MNIIISVLFLTVILFTGFNLFKSWKKFNINKFDKIFIIIFILILIVPATYINNRKKSNRENRNLAQFPSLTNTFGKDFEVWFNDHFTGRKDYIKLHENFKNNLNFKKENNSVLFEKDNWLFFKVDDSLKNFQNKNLFTDEELKGIAKYLNDIDKWCKKNNKQFYYFIAPDKNKIYGEFINLEKIRPDSESRANQLIKHLKENTQVEIIYPYDYLHSNKDKGLLYWKSDSHWNKFGAYLGYQALMQKIQKNFKVKKFKYTNLTEEQYKGDLIRFSNSTKYNDNTFYKVPVIAKENCEFVGKNPDKNDIFLCNNDKNNLNIIIFRDSFMSSLAPYLNYSFKNADFYWRYIIKKEDLQNIKDNYDIVVLQNVERHATRLINLKFEEDK